MMQLWHGPNGIEMTLIDGQGDTSNERALIRGADGTYTTVDLWYDQASSNLEKLLPLFGWEPVGIERGDT